MGPTRDWMRLTVFGFYELRNDEKLSALKRVYKGIRRGITHRDAIKVSVNRGGTINENQNAFLMTDNREALEKQSYALPNE